MRSRSLAEHHGQLNKRISIDPHGEATYPRKMRASARDPLLPEPTNNAQSRGPGIKIKIHCPVLRARVLHYQFSHSGPRADHALGAHPPRVHRAGTALPHRRPGPTPGEGPGWAPKYDDSTPRSRNRRGRVDGRPPYIISSASAYILGSRYPTQSTARGPRSSLGPAPPGT